MGGSRSSAPGAERLDERSSSPEIRDTSDFDMPSSPSASSTRRLSASRRRARTLPGRPPTARARRAGSAAAATESTCRAGPSESPVQSYPRACPKSASGGRCGGPSHPACTRAGPRDEVSDLRFHPGLARIPSRRHPRPGHVLAPDSGRERPPWTRAGPPFAFERGGRSRPNHLLTDTARRHKSPPRSPWRSERASRHRSAAWRFTATPHRLVWSARLASHS
jgi:hypothetical protein